jgi:dihydrofolate reductase
MAKISIFESVTLDGVMQAPGRPDEDTRDGFTHGGWAAPYADPVMGEMAAEGMGRTGGILLGRRTYLDFYGFWPHQTDNPFTDALNSTRKYVVSRTLKEPLPWQNSTLLSGDAADAVRALRNQPGDDIVVLGSGELARTLMAHDLVDEYVLLVHPLVLGSGRRLFSDDGRTAALRLVESRPTTTGVLIATYRPADSAEGENR